VITGAALLVLLGLGLFVAGLSTGTAWLYWACVATCAVAAVLLVLTRRQMVSAAAASPPTAGEPAEDGRATTGAVPVVVGEPPPVTDGGKGAPADLGDPPVEEVEVTDLLLVLDLTDEVLVVDEHPRYHLEGCPHVAGRTTIPLPLDEARTDGFTPCAVCAPDRHLAERARARK
jgi:hypothetical protein